MHDDNERPRNKPEPKEERLKIDETDWERAVDGALKKKRPPEGWPKQTKEKPRGK